MSNYKKKFVLLKNNIVHQIIESENIEDIKFVFPNFDVKQCDDFYGQPFIGCTIIDKAFVRRKPHNSWTWNNEKKDWQPPIDFSSNNDSVLIWNEELLNWEKIK